MSIDDEFEDKTVIADIGSSLSAKPKSKTIASLVQYSGKAMGKRYTLEGPTIKIGRSPDAQISITENSVSRTHAVLSQSSDRVEIEDAGSSNGTYINDVKISGKNSLKDQDMITLGEVILKFFSHDNIDGFVQDKIYKMATIDAGTQIFNKQYLIDSLDAEFKSCQSSQRSFSIVYFDLDHFKKVNDTYGHNAGDLVLSEGAVLVKSLVRKDDVFARFGGEEFVVILPNTELQKAYEIAETIRKAYEGYTFNFEVTKDSQTTKIAHKQTISLGVAQFTKDLSAPKELLEVADKKLYESKSTGRNKTTF